MSEATVKIVLQRRHLLSQSRHCLLWAAINGLFLLFLAIDFQYSICGSLLDSKLFRSSVLILEIELTSSQMKAFGVKPNELGFKESKPMSPIHPSSNETKDQTVGSLTPPFEMSYWSDFEGHSSLNSTHLSMGSSTALSNGSNCGNDSLNSTTTSWEYNPHTSPSNSSHHINDSNTAFVRLRRNTNKLNYIQPIVTNERQLTQYLKDFEIKEQRFEEMTDSQKRIQSNGGTTLWNSSPNSNNYFQEEDNQSTYQIAIDFPLQLNNADLDSLTSSPTSSKAMDSLLTKLNINEVVLNQWIENIRKWISQTIICRLIEQIDKTNETLAKSGHFEAIIGQTSLQSLKQLSTLKKSQLSILDSILPFLEVTTNQAYLIQRIRDLSKGGCIGKFIWNSGGSYNLKQWNQQMLTDSAIIMHLFCTYMDLRLPSDPNSPEGKAFTNYYFKSMTGVDPKSLVYILEAKVNPPHYKVFTEKDGLWDLPIGRNNLFHSILVFLNAIKNQQLGHLGRINLGSSGVNILWVIQR